MVSFLPSIILLVCIGPLWMEENEEKLMIDLMRGRETTPKQLIDEMGDAVVGFFVTSAIGGVWIIVECIGDYQLRLVNLENDKPVATGYIDIPPDDLLIIIKNPQVAIQAYQSRYHLICKAYGLRH